MPFPFQFHFHFNQVNYIISLVPNARMAAQMIEYYAI